MMDPKPVTTIGVTCLLVVAIVGVSAVLSDYEGAIDLGVGLSRGVEFTLQGGSE